jgi:sialic acid synthase
MNKGDIIHEEDLHMLSPGDGYKWDQLHEIVGKQLKRSIPANEIVYPKDIE